MAQKNSKSAFIFLLTISPIVLFAAQFPTNSPAPLDVWEWKTVLLAILLFGIIPIAGVILSVFFAPTLAIIIPTIIYTSASILAVYVLYLKENMNLKWKTAAAIYAVIVLPLTLIIVGITASISWLWISGIILLLPFLFAIFLFFFSFFWSKRTQC